jgi:hypothetical protein
MKKSEEKIVVLECPEVSKSEEARLQLLAASYVLHQRAAEAHAQGMHCEYQSARVETLVNGCDDATLVQVRDILVEEGLLEIEPSAIEVTSKGGEA